MVRLKPLSHGSYLAVWLLGGAPGLYLDFATFAFQVPVPDDCVFDCVDCAAPSCRSQIVTLLTIRPCTSFPVTVIVRVLPSAAMRTLVVVVTLPSILVTN